jgi:hypothetical protein
MNIVMFASDVDAISTAIHGGGAGRISGGFHVHSVIFFISTRTNNLLVSSSYELFG